MVALQSVPGKSSYQQEVLEHFPMSALIANMHLAWSRLRSTNGAFECFSSEASTLRVKLQVLEVSAK